MDSQYDGSGITMVAEIDTKRSDILYGTFRTRAAVPNVPGVCFGTAPITLLHLGTSGLFPPSGFFTYFYDFATEVVSEIDIEILTADEDYASRAHYTNQPGNIGDDFDPEAYRVRFSLSKMNSRRHADEYRSQIISQARTLRALAAVIMRWLTTLTMRCSGYGEHRFDWLPGQTSFYFNGDQKDVRGLSSHTCLVSD